MFRLFLISLFAQALCLAFPAHAGSFFIDPVRVLLSESKPSAVMRVENRGSATITVQLKAMSWSQSGNRDQLADSRELLATPQVFRLRPGQVQVVRVALLRPVDDRRELAYRLLLDEVPPPPAADFRGLQMALRISMPVFVQPRAPAAATLDVMMVERDGQRQLQLSNRGQAHLQLTGLSLHLPEAAGIALVANAAPATNGLPPSDPSQVVHSSLQTQGPRAAQALQVHDKTLYLLAGQQRELSLPDQPMLATGMPMQLRAQTEAGAQAWPVPAALH